VDPERDRAGEALLGREDADAGHGAKA
jgi:hypothetical protein